MHIEVEGKTYYISIRDSEKTIKLIEEKDNIIYLAVPARLSQDNLIAYLSSNPPSNLKPNHLIEEYIPTTLPLFDTTYSVVIQAYLLFPYLKGRTVYTPKIPKSKASLAKLYDDLLIQELKQHIGFWEETLGLLVNEVCLRKLSSNYYTVNNASRRLTFERNITNRSRNFIAYLCANAIFDFLKLNDLIREELGVKYVNDWKHHQRVLKHELDAVKYTEQKRLS